MCTTKKAQNCKKTIGLLLPLALLAGSLFGQRVSPRVANAFPPAIVNKLFAEVTSKMTLSEDTQLWLARAYSHRDSLVAKLITTGQLSADNLKRFADSTDWDIERRLKKMMQASELEAYKTNIEAPRQYPVPVYKDHIMPDAEMNSLFGAALKVQDKLGLRDTQADSLLLAAAQLKEKMDFHKAHPDSGFFDQQAFESAYLSQTLSENQYSIVLANKNKTTAELQAKYDWHDLAMLGLAKKYDKEPTMKSLTIYYLLRAHVTERFAHEKDKRGAMLRALKVPPALNDLHVARLGKVAQMKKYAW